MSPSSLIFVAVVASWAAYLVVHVARRREQLATARNVDRFSSQMRVLQRRAATHPTVASRGRVTSTSLGVDHPLVAGSARRTHASAVKAHTLVEGRPTVDVADFPAPERAKGRARASRMFRWMGRFAGVSMHEVRAAFVLTSLLVALVTAVLAALGVLSWLAPVGALIAATGGVARMRAATVSRRNARGRAAAARRRERERERDDKRRREAQVVARPAGPAMPVAQEFVTARPKVEQAVAGIRSPDVFQVSALQSEASAMAETKTAADPLFAVDGWEPTPVPPPTYTLKAKAYRPLPPPMEVNDVPVPIEVEGDDVMWGEALPEPRILGA